MGDPKEHEQLIRVVLHAVDRVEELIGEVAFEEVEEDDVADLHMGEL